MLRGEDGVEGGRLGGDVREGCEDRGRFGYYSRTLFLICFHIPKGEEVIALVLLKMNMSDVGKGESGAVRESTGVHCDQTCLT